MLTVAMPHCGLKADSTSGVRIGILPAVGSGLASMAATGQLGRLQTHLDWYARLGPLEYFSYLQPTRELPLAHQVPARVHCLMVGPKRALVRPLVERGLWRGLALCRAMNLLGTIPALTARALWGIPFVMSYGADYEQIARIHGRSALHLRKWEWLRRLAFRSASAVLVSRQDLAERLQREYPGTRIIWHPNWVDLERFSPAEAPAGSRHVLYVGRLVEEKNLLRLARAVNGIWGARLRCVGEGPLQWALGGDHPASYRADCPGPRDWAELPDEYRAAGCFALASLTEGHPKALIEAMACGVPCAVSDRVGVIRHEETGLVFKADDEADMRTQIARLLDDRDLAAKLGAAARKESEQYDLNVLMPEELRLVRAAAKCA